MLFLLSWTTDSHRVIRNSIWPAFRIPCFPSSFDWTRMRHANYNAYTETRSCYSLTGSTGYRGYRNRFNIVRFMDILMNGSTLVSLVRFEWVKVGWKKLVTEFSNETFNAQIANLYDLSASLYLYERSSKKLDFLLPFFKIPKPTFQFLITNNFARTFYSPGNNKRWTKNRSLSLFTSSLMKRIY